jgi:hypothetical protein
MTATIAVARNVSRPGSLAEVEGFKEASEKRVVDRIDATGTRGLAGTYLVSIVCRGSQEPTGLETGGHG